MGDPGQRQTALPATLAAVGFAALAVRLLFFVQLGRTPFGRTAFLDADYYETWATRIAEGDWLGGHEPFFVEPGYLYVLAAIRWLGGDLAAIRLVQAFVGSGTAALTSLLAARLTGSIPAAAVAGGLVALYGPLVHFEGQLLKTTFEVFAATATLTLAIAPRWRPLWVGLASGVALVLKSNFTVVVPPLLAYGAWRARAAGRPMAATLVLMLLGMAPPLVATAVRNGVVSGEWLVLPWSSGINFYIGNGPEADGLDPTLPFAEAGPGGEGAAGKQEAERRAGRALGYAESSSYWWAETGRTIATDPGRFLGLLVDKIRLLLHHYEFTDNVSFYFVRERAPVLAWLRAGWWLAVPLGAMGIVGALARRAPGRLLVGAYLLLQAGGLVAFHVVDRYRLALVPAAIVLGTAAWVDWRRHLGAPAWLLAAMGAVALALATVVPPPIGGQGQSFAGQHRMIAVDAQARGDHALAISELEQAIALNPNVQTYHFRLAVAHRLAGDAEGAARAEVRGLQLDPEHGPLRLGLLLAPVDPERAAHYCLRAAELGDRVGAALHCAGRALWQIDRREEAAVALARATAYAPRFFDAWVDLGDLRRELGDVAGAREAWQRALALRPRHEALQRRLAETAEAAAPPERETDPTAVRRY